MDPSIGLLIFGLIFGAVGLFLLRLGLAAASAYRRALSGSLRAEGVVTEMRRERGEFESYDYPVVRFKTSSGKEVEFEASIRREPPAHKVGDRVEVFYPPGDPAHADIVGQGFGNTAAILMGGAALLIGVGAIAGCLACLFFGLCPTEAPPG